MQILNASTNRLRSLHTLPDGMVLSELDIGNNQLSSLEKLAIACTELQLLVGARPCCPAPVYAASNSCLLAGCVTQHPQGCGFGVPLAAAVV
jgi:Leucine-rich repeat (LRR) protein